MFRGVEPERRRTDCVRCNRAVGSGFSGSGGCLSSQRAPDNSNAPAFTADGCGGMKDGWSQLDKSSVIGKTMTSRLQDAWYFSHA